MKIYFAASIRGGRDDSSLYSKIIEYLREYGEVLTEHIGLESLTSDGELTMTDRQIHDRDMRWLKLSDVIVAEVTNPSLGVGYEIARALDNNKKVICLYREEGDKKLSAMISGSQDIVNISYSDLNDLKNVMKKHINKL